MKTFKHGDKVQVITKNSKNIPVGTTGKVLKHEKEDEEMSYVEIDFNYKATEARLTDEDGILQQHDKFGNSKWDFVDGEILHEEHLKLI
ncbi:MULTISPECIES: hypothetical protein [Bacillus]|uniref:hypothetical protein n=1 Tax=Bacillus TaxID=1386 RepID=UPI002E24DA2A|nr:hypothetical protein [Bacillus velezensis]